jgi:hypothetical protein
MKIAVVYLGRKIPKYVIRNLCQIKANFPDQDLVFIGDHQEVLTKVSELGVDTFKAKSPALTWNHVLTTMDHPMKFRQGFWFTTTARFEAIKQYMECNEGSLLQIEADVCVSRNFPFQIFKEIQNSHDIEIAFPLQTVNTGSGSVLWISSYNSAQKLVDAAEETIKLNPKTTDMFILGRIASEGLMQVGILPTNPIPESAIQSQENKPGLQLTSREFGGIFDALTLGFYLLGEDPRNNRGRRNLFQFPSEHITDPRKLEMSLNAHGLLETHITGIPLNVYCLHNHAKDLRIFGNGGAKLLNRRLSQSKKGPKTEFIPIIFWLQATSSLMRKLNFRIKVE